MCHINYDYNFMANTANPIPQQPPVQQTPQPQVVYVQPAQQNNSGCFTKGCLISLLVFFLLFVCCSCSTIGIALTAPSVITNMLFSGLNTNPNNDFTFANNSNYTIDTDPSVLKFEPVFNTAQAEEGTAGTITLTEQELSNVLSLITQEAGSTTTAEGIELSFTDISTNIETGHLYIQIGLNINEKGAEEVTYYVVVELTPTSDSSDLEITDVITGNSFWDGFGDGFIEGMKEDPQTRGDLLIGNLLSDTWGIKITNVDLSDGAMTIDYESTGYCSSGNCF